MENTPGIIVVSCSNTKPKSLIKLITKASEVKEYKNVPGLVIQPWSIDTKYYTANVELIGLETDSVQYKQFNNNIEALILHMDTNKESGLDDLNKWETIDKDFNLDVKLLISNYCTCDTKISKNRALEWCLKHGYEFIELYPTLSSQEQEDDLREKYGVERVIESLQSHTWSNLVIKNKKKTKKNQISSLKIDKESVQTIKNEEIRTSENEEGDDFTELFSQLHMMKDSLQSMPMNQRKQCAEQMVTAFWKAIGGEEEEIFEL